MSIKNYASLSYQFLSTTTERPEAIFTSCWMVVCLCDRAVVFVVWSSSSSWTSSRVQEQKTNYIRADNVSGLLLNHCPERRRRRASDVCSPSRVLWAPSRPTVTITTTREPPTKTKNVIEEHS